MKESGSDRALFFDLMKGERARRMMMLAQERGIGSEQCRRSSDRRFLESRTSEKVEAVAYNGFCFIFEKEGETCITLYALPGDFGRKKSYSGKREGRCCKGDN